MLPHLRLDSEPALQSFSPVLEHSSLSTVSHSCWTDWRQFSSSSSSLHCSSCPVTEHSSSTTETWHTVERVNHSEIAMLFKKLISFDPIQFLYCILGYPSWQFIIWMFAIWIIPVNNCKIKETAGSWSDPLDWCSFLLKWKLVVWCRLLDWVWRVESYLWCILCQSQWCSQSRGQCHIRSHKLFCISCLWWCRTSWPVLSDRLAPDQVAQYLCLYFRHMAIWQYGRR